MDDKLTVPQAGERIGRSRYFIYDAVRAGKLQPTWLPSASGKKPALRISESDLQDFVNGVKPRPARHSPAA